MAVGLQHKNLGWRGRGVSLEFMLKKQWGVGGHRPKFKHDYTENVKNLGWRGGGWHGKFWKKTLEGWGSKIFCNPTPMYDIKWNRPYLKLRNVTFVLPPPPVCLSVWTSQQREHMVWGIHFLT